MIAQVSFTKPDRFILCPGCGKEDFRVDHLPVGTVTAWYCDGCGVRFRLRNFADDNLVECEILAGQSKSPRLVTLRSDEPVIIQVGTFALLPEDDDVRREDNARYFYEEHTCPSNFLRNVVRVFGADGEEDPHGIFKFVKIESLV